MQHRKQRYITMNLKDALLLDEMSQIKGGIWVLTQNGWEWFDDTQDITDDEWDLAPSNPLTEHSNDYLLLVN